MENIVKQIEEQLISDPTPTSPHVSDGVVINMPVNVRSTSLVIVALLACLFLLHWAKAVFVPLMLAIIFSYALSPCVNWMEHRRVPRWLGAAILMLAICGGIGSAAYSLSTQATQIVNALPAAAYKLRQALKPDRGSSDSALQTVQKAATQIAQAAQESGTPPVTTRGATRVVIEQPIFNIKNFLWSGTIGFVALIGQGTAVLFLTYFLMLAGDTFRRKMVKIAGPKLSKKKVTLQALNEITGQIQRYLQVQLLTSALVGVLTGVALYAIGLENAVLWGIGAGVLNLIPYAGALATAAGVGLVGFLQFGSFNMVWAVTGAALGIHAVVGNVVTPLLTSRASQLGPVAVFVGLLAWGWLWGIWGLLLGIPILMIVKSTCDRVDDLKPIGEFLGC